MLCGVATAAGNRVESSFFVASDGVRLHVLEAGPAERSPVIAFVPGWSMPAAIWRAQLESLGLAHRVAALDPRGQGRSEIPRAGYTADRRAADIAEFVARYPKVVLVGWSLGALESLHYVSAHGEAKLAGLVLVDSSVGEPPAPKAGTFRDDLRRDRAAALDRFVRAMFRTPRPEDELAALTVSASQMPLDASLALLAYPYRREHWRTAAHAVKVPLLYAVTPQFAAQAGNLKRNRPATHTAVFEHAGHALFVDEPARFNALLADFVARL
jgi:microsomal epoxide hydrolase